MITVITTMDNVIFPDFKAKAEKERDEYSAEYSKAVDDVNRMNDKGEIPPTPYRAPDRDGA